MDFPFSGREHAAFPAARLSSPIMRKWRDRRWETAGYAGVRRIEARIASATECCCARKAGADWVKMSRAGVFRRWTIAGGRCTMGRSILDEAHIHPAIRETIANNHADIVQEVKDAIAKSDIVVVGMAQNPMPKKARKLLDRQQLSYRYLEYGSYLSDWRRRNALKMWTGWPTFPMVFVNGVLIGGANDLQKLIESGELAQLLGMKT